jgi:hypothetical protein
MQSCIAIGGSVNDRKGCCESMVVKHTHKVLAWDLSEMDHRENLVHTGVKDQSKMCSYMTVVSQVVSHVVSPAVVEILEWTWDCLPLELCCIEKEAIHAC